MNTFRSAKIASRLNSSGAIREPDRVATDDFTTQLRLSIRDEGKRSQARHGRRLKRLFLPAVLLLILVMFITNQGKPGTASTSLPATALPIQASAYLQASPTALLPASEVPTLATGMQPVGTAVMPVESGSIAQNSQPTGALPTPAPDPLRFSFPQPPPAPVSAWRPPLYPIPWALSPYDHFYFTRPIAADEINWPLWDYRYGGIFFKGVVHTGIDITAPKGTPVLAAGSGEVVWAGYGLYRGGNDPSDPYGKAVSIHHDFGYQGQDLYTVYGHMDRVDVVEGQHIEAGQMLGLSGETGKVTGPHLHFEVRIGKNDYFTTRNPELWLVPPQGWGVLVGRVMDWSAYQFIPSQEVIIQSKANAQNWLAKTYGKEAVNSDSYYRENLVVGDLPAGYYEVKIPLYGFSYQTTIQIHPGEVTYFSFSGRNGFDTQLPAAPGTNFNPDSDIQ